MKKWKSIESVHEHAQNAVGKKVRDLVTVETLKKYYNNPKNKGWLGNAIESDWFFVPNNSRKEADIPYLNLEIKVTPIKHTKKGWNSKERLVLNVFDFNTEINRTFETASFIEKANLIELVYYEYLKNITPPNFEIKAATLLDLKALPEEDLLIIKQDWEIIINKIREGKAEELSDSLTKYLGATTKGSKSERNLTSQPFSNNKAHRRAFTLKGAYMSQMAKEIMGEHSSKKIINNTADLKIKSFEDIIVEKFEPFIGMNKINLAQRFNINILKKNDKASSANIAKKMLEIQNTEEFKKAGISAKIVTFDSTKKQKYPTLTQNFKLLIPGGNSVLNPFEIIQTTWELSDIYNYLSSYKFLLICFEKTSDGTIFRGVKFWHVPLDILNTEVKAIWIETQNILNQGVTLTYTPLKKPTKRGKFYKITNNLPSKSGEGTVFHVRPSSEESSYIDDNNSMKLPYKSNWVNRPTELAHDILSDYYMTEQAWWFSRGYMYQQVKELFK